MFALNIPVTSASLDAIKAELTRTLSHVKSSHRCEAIARGLGYRTYAALLAATRAPITDLATAQGSAFSGYLAEHGFNVPVLAFYHAVTRVARQAVLERMPKLTMWGIGVGAPSLKSDGTRENWKDLVVKFDKERADLLGDHATEPFLLALAFVSRVERTKTIRSDADSYWLKHMAEKYACTFPEGGKLGPQYVTNGILIAAAVHAGFSVKSYLGGNGYDSLNVSFNMSKRSLTDLECEIRPDGARAQDRRRKQEGRSHMTTTRIA